MGKKRKKKERILSLRRLFPTRVIWHDKKDAAGRIKEKRGGSVLKLLPPSRGLKGEVGGGIRGVLHAPLVTWRKKNFPLLQ